ncbi:MAG: hypothetical protein ABIV25_13180 [Paracoccaceae bacterium]
MRIHIAHEEKRAGFLRGATLVDVVTNVEFSEEELAIIERRRLKYYVVLERAPRPSLAAKLTPEETEIWAASFHLRVADLMDPAPDRFTLDTPLDAKAYQAALTDALKSLKAFIMSNASVGNSSTLEF